MSKHLLGGHGDRALGSHLVHTLGSLVHHVGKVLASLLLRLHTPGIRRCGLLEASKLIWLLLYLRLLGL